MPSNRNIEQVAESKMADNRPLYILLALERGSLLVYLYFIPNYASFIELFLNTLDKSVYADVPVEQN